MSWELVLADEQALNARRPKALQVHQDALVRMASSRYFMQMWSEARERQGSNDIDVEVMRDGKLETATLTEVREGEVFQVVNKESGAVSHSFVCRTRARNMGGDPRNPPFITGVAEILQAPSAQDPVRRLSISGNTINTITNY